MQERAVNQNESDGGGYRGKAKGARSEAGVHKKGSKQNTRADTSRRRSTRDPSQGTGVSKSGTTKRKSTVDLSKDKDTLIQEVASKRRSNMDLSSKVGRRKDIKRSKSTQERTRSKSTQEHQGKRSKKTNGMRVLPSTSVLPGVDKADLEVRSSSIGRGVLSSSNTQKKPSNKLKKKVLLNKILAKKKKAVQTKENQTRSHKKVPSTQPHQNKESSLGNNKSSVENKDNLLIPSPSTGPHGHPPPSRSHRLLPTKVDVLDTSTNHEEVSEYVKEIYTYLYELETRRSPVHGAIAQAQAFVTPKMRNVLGNWLVEIVEEYNISSDVLYLGVQLLDRCLWHFLDIKVSRMQLLGCACLFVASKWEGFRDGAAVVFAEMTDFTYSRDQILLWEGHILRALDFDIIGATSKLFLRRYQTIAGSIVEEVCLSNYYAELGLVAYDMLVFKQSEIAAGALYLARWVLYGAHLGRGLVFKSQVGWWGLGLCLGFVLSFLGSCFHFKAFYSVYSL